jgi:hypothetical protein
MRTSRRVASAERPGYPFRMPKTLVLFAPSVAPAATALADAARSVRFSEVDVRVPDDVESLASYDAVAVGGLSDDELRALLARAGARPDTVGAAFGDDEASRWDTLRTLAAAGCLLVPPSDDLTALGRRVANVAEWVRHAKSHHHH